MKVYLIRHAIAEEHGAPGVTNDDLRRLTPDGIRKMQRNAQALRRLNMDINEIWTSPLTRARQTAEILAADMKLDLPIHNITSLAPNGRFEDLLLRLSQQPTGDVALVGHEPYLGELVAHLIGAPRPVGIALKKGGAACVTIEGFTPPLSGTLNWLITPRQLRQLSK